MDYRAHGTLDIQALLDNAGWMKSLARALVTDDSSADDLVQDAWTALLEHRPQRVSKWWFARVLRNTAFSRRRSDISRRKRERKVSRRERVNLSPEELAETAELQRKAVGSVLELKEPYRSTVLLRYFFDLSAAEIAREQGVPATTVRSRLSKALALLRTRLDSACGNRERWHTAFLPLLVNPDTTWLARDAARSTAPGVSDVAETSNRPRPLSSVGTSMTTKVAFSLTLAAIVTGLICGTMLYLDGNLNVADSADGSGPGHEEKEGQSALQLVKKGMADERPARTQETESSSSAPQAMDSAQNAVEEVEAPVPTRGEAEGGTGKGDVSGRVVDQQRLPIAGAEVVLGIHGKVNRSGQDLHIAFPEGNDWNRERVLISTTDRDGQFVFEDVPEKSYAVVVAFKDGYYCERIRLNGNGRPERTSLTLRAGPGKTFRGVITSLGGGLVTDAVVKVLHSYNEDNYAGYPGLSATDERGRFSLGLPRNASYLTLLVNSPTEGSQFFRHVQVDANEVYLQYQPKCSVGGTIVWDDGKPAADVSVCVSTTMPEAQCKMVHLGIIPVLNKCATTDEHGTFEMSDLQPEFTYRIQVRGFSPRRKHSFRPKPGEHKIWNYTITEPMRISGRVLTARTRTPVPDIDVCVQKDGASLYTLGCETNKEGEYALVIRHGPGNYVITATRECSSDTLTALFSERFGRNFTFQRGEELEVDLEVFEPIELPVRVLDVNNHPMETVRYKLSYRLPQGKRYGTEASLTLDSAGRGSFKFYHPVDSFSLTMSAFTVRMSSLPKDLLATLGPFKAEVGTLLPEETVVIRLRTCDVSGVLRKKSGEPHAGVSAKIRAKFSSGSSDTFSTRTDSSGRFVKRHRLRAAPVTLTFSVEGIDETWTSGLLHPQKETEVSLGTIVVGE